jgi:hypothetical protein
MSTDRNIEVAVREELVSDPLLDANGIVVEVTGGAVSLTGTVPSQAQHVEAAAAARRVTGVTTVDTMLAVALPADDYGDDAALARLANQALAANAVPDTVKATAGTATCSSPARSAATDSAMPHRTPRPA